MGHFQGIVTEQMERSQSDCSVKEKGSRMKKKKRILNCLNNLFGKKNFTHINVNMLHGTTRQKNKNRNRYIESSTTKKMK